MGNQIVCHEVVERSSDTSNPPVQPHLSRYSNGKSTTKIYKNKCNGEKCESRGIFCRVGNRMSTIDFA